MKPYKVIIPLKIKDLNGDIYHCISYTNSSYESFIKIIHDFCVYKNKKFSVKKKFDKSIIIETELNTMRIKDGDVILFSLYDCIIKISKDKFVDNYIIIE